MKKIHLTALDIDLEVPNSIDYQDEAFKETRRQSLEKLQPKSSVGGKCVIKYEEERPWNAGINIYYYSKGIIGHFIRGHEETHALRGIDQLLGEKNATTKFLIKFSELAGTEINISQLEKEIKDNHAREEIIANLGGFMAVRNKNHSMWRAGENYLTADYGLLTAKYHFNWYIKSLSTKRNVLKN